MKKIVGELAIRAARKLVESALGQPNIFPQIRSDLMAICNRLDRAEESAELQNEQCEILEAYIGIARRQRLSPKDEAMLTELARQLA
ncbi:hypothetical protein [Fulvimarina sp. MAC8]|uniref:hypothetical protein n=1 Tax=Fulvimarina sp. MAC8 TaxID=3162874 RepID=UPI0032EE4EDE